MCLREVRVACVACAEVQGEAPSATEDHAIAQGATGAVLKLEATSLIVLLRLRCVLTDQV